MKKTVLVVDDDRKVSALIDFRLKKMGYQPECVFEGSQVMPAVRRTKPFLILLDLRLPDADGVDLLKQIKGESPRTRVMMISAHADIEKAVNCMREGAYDFIEKPVSLRDMETRITHVFEQFEREKGAALFKKELGRDYKYKSLLGKGPQMEKVFRCIQIAARSDVNVLIEGESGTGKELVARAIHYHEPAGDGLFIAVNCGAIPGALLESELFGFEKGAFTGAEARHEGKFERARGGTLFLDEIGELPQPLQVKLLRVLQERELERIGGSETIPVETRIIAATNKSLRHMVREGRFREDLFYRLNVLPVRLPPLRERSGEIPSLLNHFVSRRTGREVNVRIDPVMLRFLSEWSWPGNVRELENFVERIFLIKGHAEHIGPEDLDLLEAVDRPKIPDMPRWNEREKVIGQAEKNLFTQALKECGGNIAKACRMLQISRDTFYRKMKKYAIQR